MSNGPASNCRAFLLAQWLKNHIRQKTGNTSLCSLCIIQTMTSFVHLRAHTEYSVVDGFLRIGDLVKAAAKDGQGALAITDLNNLFGALKLYSACRKKGIKPIIAAEVSMGAWPGRCGPSQLVLIAQNQEGYNNLCELLSKGWVDGVKSAKDTQAVLDWSWLGAHSAGLIALSAAAAGAVGQALLSGKKKLAEDLAADISAIFPSRFYLEVQRCDRPDDERHVQACVELAVNMGLPLVATHPIQFMDPSDHAAHEARICIAQGVAVADPARERIFVREQHFKTSEEMGELFADLPQALDNTVAIAKRCNLTLVLGKPQLPNFPTPLLADGTHMSIDAYFRELSIQGLGERLEMLYPDPREREQQCPRYEERLEFEIKTILKMGFPGYFLIVADFIVWAKQNGCPVGPGRGSGAGSLVAYSLKITDLDPLEYQLLFERFLNPDRVSMPDFDIDFCRDNRDRVIDYVKQKYGKEAVSQIATFGTMAAKAALRDVGRSMGMGYGQVDSISKLIPAPPGKYVTLAQVPEVPEEGVIYARKESPELLRREAADEEIAALLGLAAKMEGTVRNIGMHAGGVLIAPGKITDFCPLYQQPGSTSAVSQFDKDDVENAGLVKFDFLGLATLTILEIAREFISKRHPTQRDFSYERISLTDSAVFELFCEGRSEAVFQFESPGMQAMLREAKPSRLEDLIALNALYRPGPMDLIPTFIARKHGRERVEYPHPLAEKVLSETYGIMVYQEQVMQVAQILGGYTLGGADLLRRAMGKKKVEEMAKHRAIFAEGAAKNGISAESANDIFSLMEKFAGYGFNKSHAAAYSLLAYHTAFIKVHFTPEFFAANLTVEQGDTDKLKVLLEDAKAFDVVIDLPNINLGTARFEPTGSAVEKRIRYSLAAIKGTGTQAIEAIVAERNANGPFTSFFDFCKRVDKRRLNKRILEALIKAGAFDALHPNRASSLASVSLAMGWAEAQHKNVGQGGLFDDFEGSSSDEPEMIAAVAWGVSERLENERSAIGFFLSGHLMDEHREEIKRFCPLGLSELHQTDDPVVVSGVIREVKIFDGDHGRSAIVIMDDGRGSLGISVSPEVLQMNKDVFKEDALIVVKGKLSVDRRSGGFRLRGKEFMDLSTARSRFARHVVLEVQTQGTSASTLSALMQDLRVLAKANQPKAPTPGAQKWEQAMSASVKLPLRLIMSSKAGKAEIALGQLLHVEPTQAALNKWRSMGCAVSVVY
jgi:DNA polymerase-3 subunit alpha